MDPSRAVANFDSASGMLRATARFLRGRGFPKLGSTQIPRPLVRCVNYLPSAVREQLYIYGGWWETIPEKQLGRVRSEGLGEWAAGQYPRQPYPAVMLGSSNGAAVHLCCALGVPWLPQTLLLPVGRWHADPDAFVASLESARAPARALLDANPDLQLHHMHDPNQDRLMIRMMAYFRVKRRRLGRAYEEFIHGTLAPNGTIFLLECGLSWPAVTVGERHYFQPGALGGARPDEYLDGGPRVDEFLRRQGADGVRWDPPRPDAEKPEAEWGFEPSLREDVLAFARRHGYRVRRVCFPEPEDLSPFVADVYRWWYARRGLPTDRLVGESFILLDPLWTIRTARVPFWSAFAVEPSARRLEQYLDETDGPESRFRDIRVMLFSHGVESIGYAPPERWRPILGRASEQGAFLGVDESAFPRDFATFVNYHRDLKRLDDAVPMPAPLTLTELDEFIATRDGRRPVEWIDG